MLGETEQKLLLEKPAESKLEAIAPNWEALLLTYRHLDIKILEVIYLPQAKPLTFNELYSRISRLNFCSKTVRRRLKKLEDDGLVRTFNSTITFINPMVELEKSIQTLTVMWEARNKVI